MSAELGLDGWPAIIERAPLPEAAVQNSGANLERVLLADGRRLVLKQLPSSGDWLTRMTVGQGRTRLLWDSGVLDRVAKTVDHGIVTVVAEDGGDVVVMRDVGEHLLRPGVMVPITRVRQLLAGLASFHRDWEGRHTLALCPLDARYRLFSPSQHAADNGPAVHPAQAFIVAGWEAFGELVPAEVAEAVFAIHAHPRVLSEALDSSAPSTLLHGDAKLDNLGLDGDRLVAVDWGELTGTGPAEVDVAWFAIQDGWRFDVTPDVIFTTYDELAHHRLEPMATDLACIGALVWFGFKIAGRLQTGDEATRTRSEELLAWWVTRVRDGLSNWSPAFYRT